MPPRKSPEFTPIFRSLFFAAFLVILVQGSMLEIIQIIGLHFICAFFLFRIVSPFLGGFPQGSRKKYLNGRAIKALSSPPLELNGSRVLSKNIFYFQIVIKRRTFYFPASLTIFWGEASGSMLCFKLEMGAWQTGTLKS